MSKPWGKINSWAAEAEQAEAEEKEEAAAAAAAAATRDSSTFPSLKEAAVSKPKRKVKMSLQQFTMQGTNSSDYNKGLTPEEMMRLPTGPKERSADEMQYGGRLGGGFSSYGRSSGPPQGRREDGDSSWSGGGRRSYGGFDDDRRGPPPSRVSDFDQPSRADEVDNWAMGKKPMPAYDSGRPRFSGGAGGGGAGGFSRADDVDSWAFNKKPVATAPAPRSLSFGSGFRDSVAPETERWTRGMEVPREGGGQERRRLVLDPPKGGESLPVVKSNKPSPFGAARPREEILAEKGLDWKKVDLELEAKKVTSRPTSSQSNSRPGSAQSNRSDAAAVALPKPKVNPFGDAKPREVLLQEKGLDWRKIDLELEHRRVDRPETEAEKLLREEIDLLKKELEKESVSKESAEYQTGLQDQILLKESELETLIRELDDKIRFGQKAIERPGSGAGRVGSFQERPGSGAGRVGSFQERPGSGAGRVGSFQERPGSGAGRVGSFHERPGSGAGRVSSYQERPPSQSGSYDESRSVEFTETPRSRGGGDAWARPGEDRRGFAGVRETGFLGNRDPGRSMSRDRW